MSFALDLEKFAARAAENMDQVVRQITASVANSVVMKSPVDTGRFRGNWMFGDGAINDATTETADRSGNETMSRLAAAIGTTKAGGVTYISNSVPYAQRLEYGWSKQAPVGMVRVTVAEFQHYVDGAVRNLDK